MRFSPTVITGPSREPVSRAEVRHHLRLEDDPEQLGQLDLFVSAARHWFEARTSSTVHETEYLFTLDLRSVFALQAVTWPASRYIPLPRATPLVQIVSFKYADSSGNLLTVSPSLYIADTFELPGRLTLAVGESWPPAVSYPVAPVRIQYRAGLAASPQVEADADTKIAHLLLIGALWENRETEVVADSRTLNRIALAYGVEAFIQQHIADYAF